MTTGLPEKQGLYDPANEHDACGFGFVVDIEGRKSHDIVQQALQVLVNLEHRGAAGAEKNTGDGAGILLQMPRRLPAQARRPGSASSCPRPAATASAWSSCPPTRRAGPPASRSFEETVRAEGQLVLGWRDVPSDAATLGDMARASQPVIRQVFVGARRRCADDVMAFERKLYVIRRLAREVDPRAPTSPGGASSTWPASRARTIVYKGMLNAGAAPRVLPGPVRPGDGVGPRHGALALLHQHLPELGARPPVPLHLPQRRDQHAARQHQLDARAPEP